MKTYEVYLRDAAGFLYEKPMLTVRAMDFAAMDKVVAMHEPLSEHLVCMVEAHLPIRTEAEVYQDGTGEHCELDVEFEEL